MIDNNSEVLIKVENLHKDFGGLQVLKGIDFQVRKERWFQS